MKLFALFMLIWNASANEETYRISPVGLKYWSNGCMSWYSSDRENGSRKDGSIFSAGYEAYLAKEIREGRKPHRTRVLSWPEVQWLDFKHWWRTGETQAERWAYFMGSSAIRSAKWELEYRRATP